MENKKQTPKAAETINKEQLEKLLPEDWDKVVGGLSSDTKICPYCGMEFDKYGGTISELEMRWHMAQHLIEENTQE